MNALIAVANPCQFYGSHWSQNTDYIYSPKIWYIFQYSIVYKYFFDHNALITYFPKTSCFKGIVDRNGMNKRFCLNMLQPWRRQGYLKIKELPL